MLQVVFLWIHGEAYTVQGFWSLLSNVVLWLSWRRTCLQCGRPGFDPWVGKIPWRRERLPTPVFWPGEFHGLYTPWGPKEWDMTERLSVSNVVIPLLKSVQPISKEIHISSVCDLGQTEVVVYFNPSSLKDTVSWIFSQ